jgi:NTP pyrophosphatase (non-canonical NTP hydrolase)
MSIGAASFPCACGHEHAIDLPCFHAGCSCIGLTPAALNVPHPAVVAGEALKALQKAIASSLNEQQKQTDVDGRALFLVTEIGEALKELLKYQGYYGMDETMHARAHLRKELCDVIWNTVQLANQLELDLGEAMDALIRYNPGRKHW